MPNSIITTDFRLFTAQQMMESVSETDSSNIYFFIARPTIWANILEYYYTGSGERTALAYDVFTNVAKVYTGSTTLSSATWSGDVNKKYSGTGYLYVENIEGSLTSSSDAALYFANAAGEQILATGDVRAGRYFQQDEANPVTPLNTLDYLKETYDQMLALKRLSANNLRVVIDRRDWEAGVTYDEWNSKYAVEADGGYLTQTNESSLESAKFYAMNDAQEVFMCVSSPDSVSSDPPTTEDDTKYDSSSLIFSGSDNYKWRFMFEIPAVEWADFTTNNFIPIPLKSSSKRKLAEDNPTETIQKIRIRNGGAGYAASQTAAYVRFYDAFTATKYVDVILATNSSGTITSANIHAQQGVIERIISYGIPSTAYTAANRNTEISSWDSGVTETAQLDFIIPPPSGYGADVESQLKARTLMINESIGGADIDVDIPISSEYRQYGLIVDPEAADGTPATADTLRASKALRVNSAITRGIKAGDVIKLKTADSEGQKYGLVISFDLDEGSATVGNLSYINPPSIFNVTNDDSNVARDFVANEVLVLAASPSAGDITVQADTATLPTGSRGIGFNSGVAVPEIKRYTGKIMQLVNTSRIIRSADQIERVKLSLKI